MRKIIIAMIFFLLVVLCGFGWDNVSLFTEFTSQQAEAVSLQESYQLDKTKLFQIEQAKSQFKNSRIKMSQLKAQPIYFLTFILQVARQSGMTVQTLQPCKIQDYMGFHMLPINLVAVANFYQWTEFIRLLIQQPFVINDFKLHLENDGNLQITAKLWGFSLPVSLAALPNFLSVNRNPFAVAMADLDTYQINRAINIAPLQQIKFIGRITQANTSWGIVMLPDGNTYDVAVGVFIGKERAKIIKINEHEMIVALHHRLREVSNEF